MFPAAGVPKLPRPIVAASTVKILPALATLSNLLKCQGVLLELPVVRLDLYYKNQTKQNCLIKFI
jgi:hypothetical protein